MWSIVVVLALMIPLIAVILDSRLGQAIAARLERDGQLDDSAAGRLSALEAEVERLNRELLRLEEESEFVHRLLQERARPSSLPSPNDAD